VGTEKSGYSEEYFEKTFRIFTKVNIAVISIFIIAIVVSLSFEFIKMNEEIKYKNTEMLADLYLKAKDYDTAIYLYETYKTESPLVF